MTRRTELITALSVSLAGVACAESGTSGSPATRTDSAGVEIVESTVPAWTTETAPVVSAAPTLRIGSVDGPEETQLFEVRFATVLSDARIVIGNSGTSELRFFGPDGSFEFAVGGEGEGPGEFGFISSVYSRLPGDTLRVFDGSTRRITEFTGSGDLVRSVALDPPEIGDFGVFFSGTFQDGRLAVNTLELPPTGEMSDGDLVRGERTYWALDAVDAAAGEVARLLDPERLVQIVDGGVRIYRLEYRIAEQAVAHADLVVASTDRHEVRWYTPDGALRRIARWEGELRELTPDMFEEWLDGLEGGPEVVANTRALNEDRLPSRLPTMQSLLVDEAGNAWLRGYEVTPSDPDLWTVISADGEWLGTVEFPPGLQPYEIGEDYVIGLWRDELDIQYVHLHELTWRR